MFARPLPPETVAAIAYAALALLPLGMQLGLALGAPWGRLTLGGRWPGRLPGRVRLLALLQAGLLAAMAAAVLSRGGAATLDCPGWAFWAALALTAATCVANLATPSRPERRLWGPVTVAMLICAGLVALA